MSNESGPTCNPFYIITLKNGSVFGAPVTTAGSPIVGGFWAWLRWLFRAIIAIVRVVK